MKLRIATVVICLAALVGLLRAQTPTQQAAAHADSCKVTQTATCAGNTGCTATIPAVTGQVFNICTITVHEVANAAITGAAAPAGVLTTTGLPTNLIWWADNATQGTGWQKEVVKEVWPTGLMVAQSTPFTIAESGGQSTQNFRINVTGWYSSAQ